MVIVCASIALTLFVGCQEEHPTCRNWVMRCCCGYLSGVRCRLFAYGPADATAIPKPRHLLPHLNSEWFYHFWYRLTQVVPEKWPLTGYLTVAVVVVCCCIMCTVIGCCCTEEEIHDLRSALVRTTKEKEKLKLGEHQALAQLAFALERWVLQPPGFLLREIFTWVNCATIHIVHVYLQRVQKYTESGRTQNVKKKSHVLTKHRVN